MSCLYHADELVREAALKVVTTLCSELMLLSTATMFSPQSGPRITSLWRTSPPNFSKKARGRQSPISQLHAQPSPARPQCVASTHMPKLGTLLLRLIDETLFRKIATTVCCGYAMHRPVHKGMGGEDNVA